MDAIAIGSQTLVVDDPLLTVRQVYRSRPLTRVIFDRSLRTSPQARIMSTLEAGPVVVLTTEASWGSRPEVVAALQAAGAEVVAADCSIRGGLERLYARGIQSVLLEGGPRLHQAAWEAGMIDEMRLFVAPSSLGPDGVAAADVATASLADIETRVVGSDILISGHVHRPR